jgi:O-antigen/teichoic acid export membrane protein
MATMLVSVPLTLHYLGSERFGLWMTITSLIATLGFADFGIGNGLLNAVAQANGRDDREAIKESISSAFAILSLIALVILVVFGGIYPLVDWGGLFHVRSAAAHDEAGVALMVFVFCFALSIPAGVVQRTQTGLQLGYVTNLWQTIGSVVALAGVLFTIHFRLGLPWLVASIAGIPVLALFANGIAFFFVTNPELRPTSSAVSRNAGQRIAHVGLYFLVQQLAVSLAYTSDNLIISRLLGPDAVTEYAVPVRLFSVVPLVLSMLLMPLWPAYGEAMARGDGKWVRHIFTRSLQISLGFTVAVTSGLLWFTESIFRLWLGSSFAAPSFLLTGLAIWKLFEAWGIPVAAFLNGANAIRVQAVSALGMAVCALMLKFVLVRSIGVPGAIWATIVSYALFTFIPLSFVTYHLLTNMEIRPSQSRPT